MPEKCDCGADLCTTCKVCHNCQGLRQVLFDSLPEDMPMELKLFIVAHTQIRCVSMEELRRMTKEELAGIPPYGPVQ